MKWQGPEGYPKGHPEKSEVQLKNTPPKTKNKKKRKKKTEGGGD